jgi:predicted nucleic acid-binding protein
MTTENAFTKTAANEDSARHQHIAADQRAGLSALRARHAALQSLAAAGHGFCIASQTISEFLAVATRPVADRGLAMSAATADVELSKLTGSLELIYENQAVIDGLRRLVVIHNVSGKSVHDTKVVATMKANSISHVLTLNGRDFARFNEVEVLDPRNLIIP